MDESREYVCVNGHRVVHNIRPRCLRDVPVSMGMVLGRNVDGGFGMSDTPLDLEAIEKRVAAGDSYSMEARWEITVLVAEIRRLHEIMRECGTSWLGLRAELYSKIGVLEKEQDGLRVELRTARCAIEVCTEQMSVEQVEQVNSYITEKTRTHLTEREGMKRVVEAAKAWDLDMRGGEHVEKCDVPCTGCGIRDALAAYDAIPKEAT